jgi:hypothetical protein
MPWPWRGCCTIAFKKASGTLSSQLMHRWTNQHWLTTTIICCFFHGKLTLQSIQPTLRRLHQLGIGAILDYAAESDVHSDEGAQSLQGENYGVIVRTYNYESEKKCDAHVGIFMKALEAAKTAPNQGFAAIKVLPYKDL